MSADQETLGSYSPRVDRRTWSRSDGSESGRVRPHERSGPDVGAWPEQMPSIRAYAASSLTIPGQGERPAGCGEWLPMEFCDSCADVSIGSTSCQTRKCPDCWYSWNLNRVTGIVERLAAAREAEEPGLDRRLVHANISAPPGSIETLTDVKQGWSEAYDLAREAGVRGGVVFFHGYRATQEAKRLYREADPDGGLWKWIRETDRDWRSLTYWSPHWHVLGLSRDFAEMDPDSAAGWVVNRIETFPPFTLTQKDGYEQMAKAATYLLSHLSFNPEQSDHAIRWFGELANNKFNPQKALSRGRWGAIQRITREVVGGPTDPDEMVLDADGHLIEEHEDRTCDCPDCDGTKSPIWDAGGALTDTAWCKRIGRDAERRLSVAFRWAIGEIQGPAGFRTARSSEEANELFQLLLDDY